jgi:hypothetical protein
MTRGASKESFIQPLFEEWRRAVMPLKLKRLDVLFWSDEILLLELDVKGAVFGSPQRPASPDHGLKAFLSMTPSRLT